MAFFNIKVWFLSGNHRQPEGEATVPHSPAPFSRGGLSIKKRAVSLILTCVLCLCLMPVAAQAAEWYEVEPFYPEYFGSSEPTTGTKEMTVDGQTVTVSVFPAGTQFSSFNGLYIGETESYVDGTPSYTPFDPAKGLPAEGVHRIKLYSMYYGYEGDV